jgi:hypothetical protein
MAVFIPPLNVVAPRSRAEDKVLKWLSRLPDQYTLLHSLGVLNHPFKNWAEADIAIVGPSGILVVEVKGGRVRRENGRWGFTNYSDRTTWKTEGPFDQAGEAAAALRKLLLDDGAITRRTCAAHAVIFPDCAAPPAAADCIKEVTQDANSGWSSPQATVERWYSYWAERSGRIDGLNEEAAAQVVQSLRGDLDLVPLLSLEIARVEEQLTRATHEQVRLLTMHAESERVLVQGRAGTGKTLLALHEATRLADQGKTVLVTCASPFLAKALATSISGQAVESLVTFVPEAATGAISRSFDALIIDEGQDLNLDQVEILMARCLTKGMAQGTWRVFMDPAQSLIQATDPRVSETLMSFGTTATLTMNCRNTQQISIMASMLSRVGLVEDSSVDGPEVETEWWSSETEHDRALAIQLERLANALGPEHVTLLSHAPLSAERLKSLETVTGIGFRGLGETAPGRIRVCTTAAFKGFDSEAVVVADIDDITSTESRMQAYVACTRARAQLVLLLSETLKTDIGEGAAWLGQELGLLNASGGRPAPITRIEI